MEAQANTSPRFIRMKEVCRKTGLAKSSIYDRVNAKTFPQPIRIGDRAVAFVESEVDAWMADIMAASRPQDPAEQTTQRIHKPAAWHGGFCDE